eukprot:TRINITY_DN15345_c0_g1_i2.p1 TRINITY_DN15345_c0_g1~~TRINITY_DN15345_c0_g1_i2.p1  ORF type:complete len:177 (-),score=18.66 TRINITY_DN15345_c0_g1_i2:795-1325(-)
MSRVAKQLLCVLTVLELQIELCRGAAVGQDGDPDQPQLAKRREDRMALWQDRQTQHKARAAQHAPKEPDVDEFDRSWPQDQRVQRMTYCYMLAHDHMQTKDVKDHQLYHFKYKFMQICYLRLDHDHDVLLPAIAHPDWTKDLMLKRVERGSARLRDLIVAVIRTQEEQPAQQKTEL